MVKQPTIGCFVKIILSTGQTVRPKSQCEQHRDDLQSGLEQSGHPPVGAFIPQCDPDGSYRPLQVGPGSVLRPA